MSALPLGNRGCDWRPSTIRASGLGAHFWRVQPKTKESLEKLRNSIALMEKREAFLQKKADDELGNAKVRAFCVRQARALRY